MSLRFQIPEPDANERSDEQYVPIPDWHRKILDERMAKYWAEGFEGTPWEEFERELLEEITKLTQK